ncbi:MAG TPA: 3-hydroxyacyl-CoA dehydrogenase/enoyl-CoA hydratase family protein [Phaeodactylibacter sp.]|nr:3-hydroxyacyl-CoA dehydrogenase/enoyl-CoA hydratase family protein [Phaeodactylibacter sp.]
MRRIKRVAVLGSGVMGTGIACHLANAGFSCLLLDILPPDLKEGETSPEARNRLAASALKKALKAKPAPLMDPEFASRIEVGNFEDDLPKIADCDWIIEVVVERLDIKQQLMERVEQHRKPGTLVSTNTSGIPIHLIAQNMGEEMRRHFCGTHFFNPPRYLRLLEVIPGPDTLPEVIDFFMTFGDRFLGKQTVLCKDTPAFIANRIGVYMMGVVFQLVEELDLTIEEVDVLTGPLIGRPKTGTFRLADLVGLDVAVKVIGGVQENCPEDEDVQKIKLPAYFQHLLDNKWFGDKTGQGFYKKTDERDERGKRIILALDLKTLEYRPRRKPKLPAVEAAKQIEDLNKRLQFLLKDQSKVGEFMRRSFAALFSYASKRIPEISDTIFGIDDALRAGFAWKQGPFEAWDAIGLETGLDLCSKAGLKVAPWVSEMQDKGAANFYKRESGRKFCYDLPSGKYQEVRSTEGLVILDNYRDQSPVYKNDEIILHDIGDGVLCLEFTSKMNAIGEGILRGLGESIRIAEEGEWQGLVIGNNADNFTVGANLMLIAMLAYEQEFDELNMAVHLFQQTSMRCRYASVPVVIATQGYTFGGGCELLMHCDSAAAAAESYIGLVEVGVGLLPGGGGTKEFALRASKEYGPDGVMIPTLVERFRTIAMGTVATSAYEAYKYGYMERGRDQVVMNTQRNLAKAKKRVLELAPNYVQPQPQQVTVLGRTGLAALYAAVSEMYLGQFISEHDAKIARKIAYVLCGGDLSGTSRVSEQYLLDMEREAFLSLCGEQKTLERIQHMLKTGKPLRN